MFFPPIQFNLDWDSFEEKTKKEKVKVTYIKRPDFCYDCDTDELYTHAMTFKCSICHKIILGA